MYESSGAGTSVYTCKEKRTGIIRVRRLPAGDMLHEVGNIQLLRKVSVVSSRLHSALFFGPAWVPEITDVAAGRQEVPERPPHGPSAENGALSGAHWLKSGTCHPRF